MSFLTHYRKERDKTMGNIMLTIERVKELAMKNYSKGGDAIVECYEDYQIRDLIDSGVNTEQKLLDFFQKQFEIDEEYRKAAKWYAYGTTEDDEIAEMLNTDSEEETEMEEDLYEEDLDPCYGCPRMDGGYNCKHCPHGDDGNYSIYDVYRPSELL